VAAVARAIQLGLEGNLLSPQHFCDELSQVAAVCDQELADELHYLPRVLAWDGERATAALRKVGVPVSQHDLEQGLPALVTRCCSPRSTRRSSCPRICARPGAGAALWWRGRRGRRVVARVLGASLGTEAIPARLRKPRALRGGAGGKTGRSALRRQAGEGSGDLSGLGHRQALIAYGGDAKALPFVTPGNRRAVLR